MVREYRCETCDKIFPKQSSLDSHKLIHTGRRDYKCTLCDYAASLKSTLEGHIRTHTKEKPHKCPHPNCGLDFAHHVSFRIHRMSHEAEGPEKFQCPVPGCGFKTPRKSYVAQHLKSGVHSDLRPFKCDLCPHRTNFRNSLKIHVQNIHSDERPFACNLCRLRFKQCGTLRDHQRAFHSTEKPFKCPQSNCNFSTKYRVSLTEHGKLHAGDKRFPCSFDKCSFRCSTKTQLARHQRVHSGERPFKCPFCPFSCSRTDGLRKHILTHTGETPFACKLCDYRSKDSGHLTRHVRHVHKDGKRRSNKASHSRRERKVVSTARSIVKGRSAKQVKCSVAGCDYATKENSSLAIHFNEIHQLPRVVIFINKD